MKTLLFILSLYSFSLFAQTEIKLPFKQDHNAMQLFDDFGGLQEGVKPLSEEEIKQYCNPTYEPAFSPEDSYYIIGKGKINETTEFIIYFHYQVLTGRGTSGGYKLSVFENGKITVIDFLLATGYYDSLEQSTGVSSDAQLKIENNNFVIVRTIEASIYDEEGNYDSSTNLDRTFTYKNKALTE